VRKIPILWYRNSFRFFCEFHNVNKLLIELVYFAWFHSCFLWGVLLCEDSKMFQLIADIFATERLKHSEWCVIDVFCLLTFYYNSAYSIRHCAVRWFCADFILHLREEVSSCKRSCYKHPFRFVVSLSQIVLLKAFNSFVLQYCINSQFTISKDIFYRALAEHSRAEHDTDIAVLSVCLSDRLSHAVLC